jgi:adenine-specific DNA-methyltransferase
MAKKLTYPTPTPSDSSVKEVAAYEYSAKRRNNPEVGLVTPDTDPEAGKTAWAFDPHLAPELRFDSQAVREKFEALVAEFGAVSARLEDMAKQAKEQEIEDENLLLIDYLKAESKRLEVALSSLRKLQAPFLAWTGKAERTSFEVDTVSLHVHEKIDPARVVLTLRSEEAKAGPVQGDLFDHAFKQESLREAVDFYKHERGWANRLVAGDSLLVMNSLLRKEGMAGQVQMFYFDPPYGIKYGSNFQPFVNKRDVKDRTDSDLTQEPEMIKAFRDTWELGIHSYLTYLRDRLLLARELLSESGSVFVQISDENVHLVRNLMDEIFGVENFCGQIAFKCTDPLGQKGIARVYDHLCWYGKSAEKAKFRMLYRTRDAAGDYEYRFKSNVSHPGGYEVLPRSELDGLKNYEGIFRRRNMTSSGFTPSCTFDLEFNGEIFPPAGRKSWSTNREGVQRLIKANRIFKLGKDPYYKQFQNDFPLSQFENCWTDKPAAAGKTYVVETAEKFIERCLLMTTDSGDLVMDITCGSGTTAFVAEKWGRRWITCDTSRVALTLAKQRLMTASFDYYALKYPNEGVRSGFIYETVPHITLKAIANNPEIDEIHARLHPGILAALEKLKTAAKQPKLQEWDVPFAFPEDWPEAARAPFDAFHKARQTMQAQMDASIAAHADREILYDRPQVDKNKVRVTGPFTVEATPFPTVQSLDEAHQPPDATTAVARSGATSRQHQWRDELVKTGIRGKGGQKVQFADLEPVPGTRYLHAIGSTVEGQPAAISFGPEHAPLEQRQVALALEEANKLVPKPKFVVFASFAFDSEAAKDIDETNWPGVTLLKAQMNPDLLTEDLKKGRASNESFWLMGQPDVVVRPIRSGDDKGKWEVEVNGFDYFNTKTGDLESGGAGNIAMWLLDPDYDGRAVFPQQIFFPMAGEKEGWSRLSKELRAQLDEEKLEAFRGTQSLPFEPGKHRRVAVKVIDDRGIESLKVINLE